MGTIEANFRTIPGTQAVTGRSGQHTVVVDRPEGVAGGLGLGLNGGQLLAMAIEDGRVLSATTQIDVTAYEGVDVSALTARAAEISTVLDAVRSGFEVDVQIDSTG